MLTDTITNGFKTEFIHDFNKMQRTEIPNYYIHLIQLLEKCCGDSQGFCCDIWSRDDSNFKSVRRPTHTRTYNLERKRAKKQIKKLDGIKGKWGLVKWLRWWCACLASMKPWVQTPVCQKAGGKKHLLQGVWREAGRTHKYERSFP
jgi:hypothetical protein